MDFTIYWDFSSPPFFSNTFITVFVLANNRSSSTLPLSTRYHYPQPTSLYNFPDIAQYAFYRRIQISSPLGKENPAQEYC